MSASLDKQTLVEIATALNTDPVFLEKDYFVCHVIKGLVEFKNKFWDTIFCGGTSLLHGFKIINRFSEDLDFRIISRDNQIYSRNERRAYRDALFKNLDCIPDIKVIYESIISRDESRFFSVMLSYPQQFESNSAIRPEIKLEGTFDNQFILGLEEKEIKPIIGEYIIVNCISNVRCMPPIQTFADKLSALCWRIIMRQRGENDRDRAVIRHLYDIHALSSRHQKQIPEIVKTAEIAYSTDRTRRGGKAPDQLSEAIVTVVDIFRKDKQYEKEYDLYVRSMCFGLLKPPNFVEAVAAFESVKGHCKQE